MIRICFHKENGLKLPVEENPWMGMRVKKGEENDMQDF